MTWVNQRIIRLFKVLHAAYADRPAPLASDQWQHDVMRRIHRITSSASDTSVFQMLEQVTWKLSPITLTMTLVCGIALMNLEFFPDWQVFQLITNGAEEINLFEFFI
jgi:hypothetical protein